MGNYERGIAIVVLRCVGYIYIYMLGVFSDFWPHFAFADNIFNQRQI